MFRIARQLAIWWYAMITLFFYSRSKEKYSIRRNIPSEVNRSIFMKAKKYFKTLIVIPIVAAFYQCSPAPMLQSPRVKSNISKGISATWDKHNDGTMGAYEIDPFNLKIGFFDRVQIGGIFFPLNHNHIIGNIKIFVNEHGKLTLFKNVSYALFGGIKEYGSDLWGERNVYAGAILATRHRFKKHEIELILQPSYFRMDFESDGACKGIQPCSNADGLQINFGTIYTLYNTTKMNMELTMGTMYRYFNNNEYKMNNNCSPKGKDLSLYNKFVIQGGIIFNFKFKEKAMSNK